MIQRAFTISLIWLSGFNKGYMLGSFTDESINKMVALTGSY